MFYILSFLYYLLFSATSFAWMASVQFSWKIFCWKDLEILGHWGAVGLPIHRSASSRCIVFCINSFCAPPWFYTIFTVHFLVVVRFLIWGAAVKGVVLSIFANANRKCILNFCQIYFDIWGAIDQIFQCPLRECKSPYLKTQVTKRTKKYKKVPYRTKIMQGPKYCCKYAFFPEVFSKLWACM